MARGKLGFGTMRLPLNSDNQADINFDLTAKMMDEFLDHGFTYVDTSYVYHNGHSENAVKRTLTSRHPRDSYTIATKLPTFILESEQQAVDTFHQQLENLGVDYVDYYLLHNMNRILYDGVVKDFHLFDHLKKWKEEGKIRHIGFSFHDQPEVLDRILTEHPETEFVQIIVNYYDADSPFIHSQACYDVIRKHGKQVVIMEPVKGGMLANVPEKAHEEMQKLQPGKSDAAWALQYANDHDGVIAVLSGMSNEEQMMDNVTSMADVPPMTEEEQAVLNEAVKEFRKEWKLLPDDIEELHQFRINGIDAGDVVEAYDSIFIQPNPGFAAENNYLKGMLAGEGLDLKTPIQEDLKIVLKDGRDVTGEVKEAYEFLQTHSF